MADTALQSSSDHPPADALVTVDGTTIFGSGVAGDPLRAAGAGGEVVTDDTLSGAGTGGSPLAVAAPIIAYANIASTGAINNQQGFVTVTRTLLGNYTLALTNVAAADQDNIFPYATIFALDAPRFIEAITGTSGGRAAVLIQTFDKHGDPVDSAFYLHVVLRPGPP